MRDKTFSLILAAALVLALGGNMVAGERGERGRSDTSGRFGQGGQAQRWDMRGPRFGARGAHGFGRSGLAFSPVGLSRLELSPEQRSQAIDVLTAHFRAGLEAGMALQDAREEVRALRQAGSADSERIISAHRAMGEARGRLEVARLKARADFTAILTPEQLEKFKRFGQAAARRGGRGQGADTGADEAAGLEPDAGLDTADEP